MKIRAGVPELDKTAAGQIPVDMIGPMLVMRQSPTGDWDTGNVLTGRASTRIDLARPNRRIFPTCRTDECDELTLEKPVGSKSTIGAARKSTGNSSDYPPTTLDSTRRLAQ